MIEIQLRVGNKVDGKFEEDDRYDIEIQSLDYSDVSKALQTGIGDYSECNYAQLIVEVLCETEYVLCRFKKIHTKTKSGKKTHWIVDLD